MYLHHTPTAMDGTTPASALIKADITVNGPDLTALTTFKQKGVNVGDEIKFAKVLYKVASVEHRTSQTHIVAHEAE